ncbi:MAG: SRPBCC domain-containing protein [Actinomycetota bacterium]
MDNNITRVARGHYTIHTETTIDAPVGQVWDTLTDFDNMSNWSSSLQHFDGDFHLGGTITVTLRAMGMTRKLDHELTEFDAGRLFAWSDPFLLGMTDYHRFLIEPIDENQSRFINTDQVKGGAAWLIGRPVANSTMKIYQGFNTELQAEAERRHRSGR